MEDQKQCVQCNVKKPIIEYELRSDTKKYRGQCKDCRNKYVKDYKCKRECDIIDIKTIQVIDNHKECRICHVWKTLDEFPQRNTKHGYRHECKSCKQNQLSQYYHETYNQKRRERKKEDVQYRLRCNHRNYVHKYVKCIKGNKTSSMEHLGCNISLFQKWLEFQFDNIMSWENYGQLWTIDHILPLSAFDLTDPKEVTIAYNWKNTRPCYDNFEKSNKLQLHHYFNNIVTVHRFIKIMGLDLKEYQGVRESLHWLREKLRHGNKLVDDVVSKCTTEMGNSQPSS